ATKSLSTTEDFYVGSGSTGTLTQTGGSVNANWGYIGYDAGGVGTYSLTAGTLTTQHSLFIGYSTQPTQAGNASGFLDQSGGTVSGTLLTVGNGGTATWHMSGGTTHGSAGFYIGYSRIPFVSPNVGTFNQDGGVLNSDSSIVVGVRENGVWNVTNGTA